MLKTFSAGKEKELPRGCAGKLKTRFMTSSGLGAAAHTKRDAAAAAPAYAHIMMNK
jgi:hypothetical protein